MDDDVHVDPALAEHAGDPMVATALTAWAASQDGRVRPLPGTHRTNGYSGAVLFGIALTRRDRLRCLTGKLFVKVLPVGSTAREPGRHERAWRSSPGFADRHLVRQRGPWYPVGDGRHLLFQEIAHGGDLVAAVDELTGDELVDAARTVLAATLNDWNPIEPDAGLPVAESTVGDFVGRELTAMESLVAARATARRLGLADLSADWVSIDDRVLPNPLRLTDADSPLHRAPVYVVVGFAHGDLHGGNVLVPRTATGALHTPRFRLVDLSNYEEDAPLTRDLVALLLTSMLRFVPQLGAAQADELLRCLVDPDGEPSGWLPPLLARLVDAVHQVGTAYATAGGWAPEWRTQYRLSLISQALISSTFDSVGPAGQRWCFTLAAEATEAYRREFHRSVVPPVGAGEVPVLPRAERRASAGARHRAVEEGNGGNFGGPGSPARNSSVARGPVLASNAPRIPAPRPHLDGVPDDGRPAPRLRLPRNAGPAAPDPDERRRSRGSVRVKMVLAAATVSGLSLIGAVPFAPNIVGWRRDHAVTPHRVTPSEPVRSEPAATDRGADRGPALPLTDPGPQLAGLALRVAGLREPTPRGRYTYICVAVWSSDTVAGPPTERDDSYREHQLWWTSRGSGREVVTRVVAGDPAGAPTVTPYAEGEWTAGRPLPARDPGDLRDQLAALREEQPPELRDAAGTLLLVVRFHRFHVLTPAQRAALLQELAATPGVVGQPAYPDRAGRVGLVVSADSREGRRETLTFDRLTGELLAHETTSPDQEVLTYELYRARTRTDSTADRHCRA
jgi:hypothetical protein